MKKLIMVVNEDRFFLSHRKDIALKAQVEGFDVTIVCKDTGRADEVKALGFSMIELPINPTGMNLREELKTFVFLWKLYRQRKPDIVHHVGLKTILWGGVAAKLSKVPGVVNAVCGLGVLFSGERPSFVARSVMQVMAWSNAGKNWKNNILYFSGESLYSGRIPRYNTNDGRISCKPYPVQIRWDLISSYLKKDG